MCAIMGLLVVVVDAGDKNVLERHPSFLHHVVIARFKQDFERILAIDGHGGWECYRLPVGKKGIRFYCLSSAWLYVGQYFGDESRASRNG